VAVPNTMEGTTTKVVFETYVEQLLAPSLSAGQVVVVDDLGTHKGNGCASWSRGEIARYCSCHPTRQTSRPLKRSSL
jgi:transposase